MLSEQQGLIVAALRLRCDGWILPRWQTAFPSPTPGILLIADELVPEWNRSSRTARLMSPESGQLVQGWLPLHDVQIMHATADQWILSGLERIEKLTRLMDVAQTWRVVPHALRAIEWGTRGLLDGRSVQSMG